MYTIATIGVICVISLVHIFVGRFRFCRACPRSTWLSLAGGVSIAYVFLYLLPKLAAKHQVLIQADDAGILGFLEHHAYLAALIGFLVFYGMDRAVKRTLPGPGTSKAGFHVAFDVEVAGFAAYNLLVAYLIVRGQTPGLVALALIAIAFVLHLLGMDSSLRNQYPEAYDRLVRWLLVGATVSGWALGQLIAVSEPVVALWFAFLAGSITIIVIEGELPDRERARFWPFLGGAATYALLLLTIQAVSKTDL